MSPRKRNKSNTKLTQANEKLNRGNLLTELGADGEGPKRRPNLSIHRWSATAAVHRRRRRRDKSYKREIERKKRQFRRQRERWQSGQRKDEEAIENVQEI
jgi:hypothetical protein